MSEMKLTREVLEYRLKEKDQVDNQNPKERIFEKEAQQIRISS